VLNTEIEVKGGHRYQPVLEATAMRLNRTYAAVRKARSRAIKKMTAHQLAVR